MSVDYFTRVQASPGWARILESFVRFVDPRPGQRTLDVGCGPGALVRLLAGLGCQAVGVDGNPDMVERAQALAAEAPGPEHPPVFREGDVRVLPFAAGEFDLVTATNVLFLLPEPRLGLREMARVCRPGGTVAMLNPAPRLSRAAAEAFAREQGLSDFDAFSLAGWGDVAERHQRWSPEAALSLLAEAGLQPGSAVEKVGPGFTVFARGQKS